MPVEKVNIAQKTTKLVHPFQMAELGYVDDFAVSVFICQGAVDWHRHIDQDELFLVQSGMVTLESEWGNSRLQPNELAVVPKSVAHRSSSFLWSTVLLFRPRVFSHRKNGDRRTAVTSADQSLHKVSVAKAAKQLTKPFVPLDLATVEDCVMRLTAIQGTFPWHQHTRHDELFLLFEGEMTLHTEESDIPLTPGEMVIVPRGTKHRPAAEETAITLLFEKRAVVSTGN